MKKAKILIALSLAFVVVMGAGVGAGTYAYYSKSLSLTGDQGATIEAKQFDPSLESISFNPEAIEPGQNTVSTLKVLKNNTQTGMNYKIRYDFIDTVNQPHNGDTYKFFENPNLIYTLSLKESNSDVIKQCQIKYKAYNPGIGSSRPVLYVDGQPLYKSGPDQDEHGKYYDYSEFNAKIYITYNDHYSTQDNPYWFVSGIVYDYDIASTTDHEFTIDIEWPYEGEFDTDNFYAGTKSRIDAYVDVIQSNPNN